MTSAVDTNVLLDLMATGTPGANAADFLDRWLQRGELVVSEAVASEIAARFGTMAALQSFLVETGIRVAPSDMKVFARAGSAWAKYNSRRHGGLECSGCGKVSVVACPDCGRTIAPRQHLVADFLIGAHAVVNADRLLTRDRGFYRKYFPRLPIVSS